MIGIIQCLRLTKKTFHKELQSLVEIGVLTPIHQSQYGTPIFIIPKKEGTVRFITDYQKLNHNIIRNPYSLPRIGDTINQLEVFQYDTVLDLNTGY